MNAESIARADASVELDAGDFEPVGELGASEAVETESQSHKELHKVRSKGREGSGEPQSIKTSPKRDWDRRKVIDWKSIREAIVAGMSYEQAAKRWGSTPGSIRVTSVAQQWPTPERIKREAEKRIAEAQADLDRARNLRQRRPGPEAGWKQGNGFDSFGEGGDGEEWKQGNGEGNCLPALSEESGPNSMTVMLSNDLVGMAESGTLQAARRALRSIKSAPESLPIRGASDLAILAKLLRSMAGLDSPQVAFNLELFTSKQPDSASLGVVIDAEDVGE